MTENVENLMLEHMKHFRASLERIERRLEEHSARLGNLEGGQASIIQHLANLTAVDASQQLSIDRIDSRLDRIERRLDLVS